MSDKRKPSSRLDPKLLEQARAAAGSRANRRMLALIAAILVVGVALGFWLVRDRAPDAQAQQQSAAAKAEVPVADLMQPGPLPDMVIGNANAPVTIVEYASMTCPHCATFHKSVYSDLKVKYIDTGKVKLVFREFPLDGRAAAASKMARCAGPEKFFPLLSVLFERQEQWALFGRGTAEEVTGELKKIARQAGISEQSYDACAADQKLLDNIAAVRDKGSKQYGVKSTPTFFINGRKLAGNQDLAAFEKAIDPLLK